MSGRPLSLRKGQSRDVSAPKAALPPAPLLRGAASEIPAMSPLVAVLAAILLLLILPPTLYLIAHQLLHHPRP